MNEKEVNPIPQATPMLGRADYKKRGFIAMLIGTLIGIALLTYCFKQHYFGQPIQWGIVTFVIGVYLGMAIQEDFLTQPELRKLAEDKVEQTNCCGSAKCP